MTDTTREAVQDAEGLRKLVDEIREVINSEGTYDEDKFGEIASLVYAFDHPESAASPPRTLED